MPDERNPRSKRLKIFLSYAAEQLGLADRLHLTLVNAGHDVFFDRTSLPPGRDYNPAILSALRGCDLVVFLVSPESVEPGAYSLTELRLAREIWSAPEGHILPVMVADTPISSIPPYLRAVSILRPEGDLVAETYAAIDALTSGWSPIQTAVGQAEQVKATVAQLKLMKLKAKIVELDREWEIERQSLLIELNGEHIEPTTTNAQFGVAVFGVMSVLVVIFVHWAAGLFMAAFSVFAVYYFRSKAEAYEAAERDYEQQRAELRARMRAIKSRERVSDDL